jgi:hypothetical protein
MAGDELMRRVAVAMLAPALGQHEFVLGLQHWKVLDVFKIVEWGGRDSPPPNDQVATRAAIGVLSFLVSYQAERTPLLVRAGRLFSH